MDSGIENIWLVSQRFNDGFSSSSVPIVAFYWEHQAEAFINENNDLTQQEIFRKYTYKKITLINGSVEIQYERE